MAFCINCGRQLPDGAKFCANCGAAVGTASSESSSKRQTVYEGEVHQCPRCNEIIPSFTTVCPSCGHEFRGTKSSSAVHEFAAKLEQIEAGREAKKSRAIKDRLYGEEITKTDEQKVNLIRSFPIPNTKEDLYEFLILAEGNINIDLYDGTVLNSDARIAVSDAWKAKFEQAYQKAKILFIDDVRMAEIQLLYNQIHKEIKKTKGKQWKQVGIIYGILGAVFVLVIATIFIVGHVQEKEEIARLEAIIVEIEAQLERGEYKYALMNADTLKYSGTVTNKEMTRKWNILREYWVDKVLAEAEAAGVEIDYIPMQDAEESESPAPATENGTLNSGSASVFTPPLNTTEATPSPVPSSTPNYSDLKIEDGAQYSYAPDEWNLYLATAVSDTVIKIENWRRKWATDKNVSFDYDVGAFKITDETNGFAWIDSAHTAFSFVFTDENDGDFFHKEQAATFILSTSKGDINKGSSYDETKSCYVYANNDWNIYKAILLTDNIIKIENWYRHYSHGDFYYGYDVRLIDTTGSDTDFDWVDDEHTAFTITMSDPENSNLKKPSFVLFEKES